MQTAGLAALGLDWEYAAHAVAPAALATFLSQAPQAGFRGLNVTIPHKGAALSLCRPDAVAARAGAVNTLLFEEGQIHGTNTDVYGFATWLTEMGIGPGGTAVVLGAGGAARAVALALADWRVEVVTRRPQPLVIDGRPLPLSPWEALPARLAEADLLVDATPRGLDPAAPALDLSPLPRHARVLDLVVAKETALTRAAARRGLIASTGGPMLLHQGARALELWTQRPAPLAAMREALSLAG